MGASAINLDSIINQLLTWALQAMAWWAMRDLRTACNALDFVCGVVLWLLKLPEPWNLIVAGIFVFVICPIVGFSILSYLDEAIHIIKHLR